MAGQSAVPNNMANQAGGQPRLSQNVVGACLRSAFIEALYDDCTDMLPDDVVRSYATEAAPLPLAAE